MWWQNSDPQSQTSSTSIALTSPKARNFLKVEFLHAKIALLEKQDFKLEAYFAKRLAKSHSAKQELQDQLTSALARADQSEKREKQINAALTKAINAANYANRNADKINQKHAAEFKQKRYSIATLEQQLNEREKDHRVRLSSHQSTHHKMEIQLTHLLAKQADLTAKLAVKTVVHEQSVKVHHEDIARCEATLAERTLEICELKKCSRDTEIKTAQSHDDQKKLVEQQVLAIAEMQAIIAALRQSVADRDATIEGLEAKLAEITNKIVELEEFQRHAEFRYSQSQDSCNESQRENAFLSELQAGATAKIEKTTAAHEESVRVANRLNDINEAQKQQLVHFRNSLDESLQAMNAAKIAQMSAESQVHRCEQAISDLQERTTQLQYRLQREAAGRRKAEAAMKQVSGSTNGDSASRIVAVQFETERRIDQLTNELKATRGLCRILQSRVNAKVEQSLNEKPLNQAPVVLPRRTG